jgi:hypothetical protein
VLSKLVITKSVWNCWTYDNPGALYRRAEVTGVKKQPSYTHSQMHHQAWEQKLPALGSSIGNNHPEIIPPMPKSSPSSQSTLSNLIKEGIFPGKSYPCEKPTLPFSWLNLWQDHPTPGLRLVTSSRSGHCLDHNILPLLLLLLCHL